MITKKLINQIIVKCMTHAKIRNQLSNLSLNERLNLLSEKDKLTRLELDDYKKIKRIYEIKRKELEDKYNDEISDLNRLKDKFNYDDNVVEEILSEELNPEYNKLFKDLEKEYENILFKYDKRIFENYTASKGDKPIPSFNWDDYQYDKNGIEKYDVNDEGGFVDMLAVKLSASRESIGTIENNLINNQENINYTDKQLSWLRKYFEDNRLPSFLTYMINGREPKNYTDVESVYYEEYGDSEYVEYNLTERWKNEFNNIKNHLDNAINKSQGLDKPTIFYHAGRVDPSLLPGDRGVWKGYKSMSFQEQVMSKHKQINPDYWNIIVLAPKGTKGVCANDERFRGYSFIDEHEYLLGRNTGYTVIDIDYEKGTEIVLLD